MSVHTGQLTNNFQGINPSAHAPYYEASDTLDFFSFFPLLKKKKKDNRTGKTILKANDKVQEAEEVEIFSTISPIENSNKKLKKKEATSWLMNSRVFNARWKIYKGSLVVGKAAGNFVKSTATSINKNKDTIAIGMAVGAGFKFAATAAAITCPPAAIIFGAGAAAGLARTYYKEKIKKDIEPVKKLDPNAGKLARACAYWSSSPWWVRGLMAGASAVATAGLIDAITDSGVTETAGEKLKAGFESFKNSAFAESAVKEFAEIKSDASRLITHTQSWWASKDIASSFDNVKSITSNLTKNTIAAFERMGPLTGFNLETAKVEPIIQNAATLEELEIMAEEMPNFISEDDLPPIPDPNNEPGTHILYQETNDTLISGNDAFNNTIATEQINHVSFFERSQTIVQSWLSKAIQAVEKVGPLNGFGLEDAQESLATKEPASNLVATKADLPQDVVDQLNERKTPSRIIGNQIQTTIDNSAQKAELGTGAKDYLNELTEQAYADQYGEPVLNGTEASGMPDQPDPTPEPLFVPIQPSEAIIGKFPDLADPKVFGQLSEELRNQAARAAKSNNPMVYLKACKALSFELVNHSHTDEAYKAGADIIRKGTQAALDNQLLDSSIGKKLQADYAYMWLHKAYSDNYDMNVTRALSNAIQVGQENSTAKKIIEFIRIKHPVMVEKFLVQFPEIIKTARPGQDVFINFTPQYG